MNVVLVTDDRIGPVMAGSALRTWEVGRVVAAEHNVVVCGGRGSQAPAPDGPVVSEHPPLDWSDVVVSAPWNLRPATLRSGARLVVDGVTPLLAELASMPGTWRVLWRRRTAACRLPLAAARADAVLVAGEGQRRWWSDQLRRAGRSDVPMLEVPFGIGPPPPNEQEPVPGVPDDWGVVLWWGGTWPWLDLETLLAARAILADEQVSLVVPVAPRPGAATCQMTDSELRKTAARFGLEPPQVVGLQRWVPYEQRHRVLRRASVLAVLHHPGEEAELSFRTRAMDGLWTGVPLLVSEGGEVARLVTDRGWGRAVPVHDPAAVATALVQLIAGGEQASARLRADREEWRWERVVEPLRRYLSGNGRTATGYGPWPSAVVRSLSAAVRGARACCG